MIFIFCLSCLKMIDLTSRIIYWIASLIAIFIIFLIVSNAAYLWLHYHLFGKSYENIPTFRLRLWDWLARAYLRPNLRASILRMISAMGVVSTNCKMFMVWIGFRPLAVIFKSEIAKVILNNSKAITKSVEYKFLEPWLGTGLLTSSSEKWHEHRKLLTPAFHFKILETFLITFNEEAAVLTKNLRNEVGKPWTDIIPMITLFTLDTIIQTTMGIHLNIQSGHSLDYLERIDEINDQFFYRVLRPWLWSDFIFFYCSPTGWKFYNNVKALHNFTRKVIKEKKDSMLKEIAERRDEECAVEEAKRKPFLELLLEHHLKDDSFTEENVREEVDTFMFEGHDTTAMAISWTLYELGQHPEIQENVYQELEDIFGNDKLRDVMGEDLKNMKYLECTIKEGLRLYPSVLFVGRQITDRISIDGYTLEPGCTCLICIYLLQRDPEQFPNPEVFDPDRFLPENSSTRHPYSYLPFSAGPRNCIGQKFAMMEMKIALAHIIRKFKITSLDPRDKIELMVGITLKNVQPVRIRFELRETAVDS